MTFGESRERGKKTSCHRYQSKYKASVDTSYSPHCALLIPKKKVISATLASAWMPKQNPVLGMRWGNSKITLFLPVGAYRCFHPYSFEAIASKNHTDGNKRKFCSNKTFGMSRSEACMANRFQPIIPCSHRKRAFLALILASMRIAWNLYVSIIFFLTPRCQPHFVETAISRGRERKNLLNFNATGGGGGQATFINFPSFPVQVCHRQQIMKVRRRNQSIY